MCIFTELPFSKCNQDENVDDDLTCGKSAAPSNAVNDSDVHLQALFFKSQPTENRSPEHKEYGIKFW